MRSRSTADLGPVQQLRFRNRRVLKSGDFETGNAKSAVALESHCVTPPFCLANFEHFSSIVLSIPCYNGLQPLKTSQKAKAYNASLCSKKKQKRWATEPVATVVISTNHSLHVAVPTPSPMNTSMASTLRTLAFCHAIPCYPLHNNTHTHYTMSRK